MDFDAVLRHVGDMGRFQYLLLFLFSVINVISAFHYFGQIFISVVPQHKCKVPQDGDFDVTSCKINNESCSAGWTYDAYYGYISAVQEFNWVCKSDWIPSLGQSIFFTGSVIGTLAFGVLSDHIGRLHVLAASNLCAFFGNVCTILSRNPATFILSRFLAGFATDSNFVMMYIIVLEYIRPSARTMGLNLCIGVFYCVACMAVPWLAVGLKTWKNFLLVVSTAHLSVLFFYFLVPESSQWLMSKGRTDEAIERFKRIAKTNKREVDPKIFEGLKEYAKTHVASSTGGTDNVWGLFRTPKLRRKMLILIFKSMVMTLCYDAISRNVEGLGYAPFVIFTATSTTILPACAFILMTQDRAGRKALASAALFVSGIFTAAAGVLLSLAEKPSTTLVVALAVMARLSINVAYNSGAQYAVELIPTSVRGQGVSIVHVMGYAASFFSPQILYLSVYWKPAPELVLGLLLILGALACLFLPETLNRQLPVTLKEGEEFGEDEGIFEFSCWKKKQNHN